MRDPVNSKMLEKKDEPAMLNTDRGDAFAMKPLMDNGSPEKNSSVVTSQEEAGSPTAPKYASVGIIERTTEDGKASVGIIEE